MIFYDFEVFKYDWLVVLIEPNERRETVIVNDRKKLLGFYEEHKKDIWVGFNSRHYDQYILKAILLGMNPKEVNDKIINEKIEGWRISDAFRNIQLNNYDVKSKKEESLKYFEGSLGNSIEESSVPFNIKRKLTEAEINETIKYCRHDVEQTLEVFLERLSDFNAQVELLTMFIILRLVQAALKCRKNALERLVHTSPRQHKVIIKTMHELLAEVRGEILIRGGKLHLVLLCNLLKERIVVHYGVVSGATPRMNAFTQRK